MNDHGSILVRRRWINGKTAKNCTHTSTNEFSRYQPGVLNNITERSTSRMTAAAPAVPWRRRQRQRRRGNGCGAPPPNDFTVSATAVAPRFATADATAAADVMSSRPNASSSHARGTAGKSRFTHAETRFIVFELRRSVRWRQRVKIIYYFNNLYERYYFFLFSPALDGFFFCSANNALTHALNFSCAQETQRFVIINYDYLIINNNIHFAVKQPP